MRVRKNARLHRLWAKTLRRPRARRGRGTPRRSPHRLFVTLVKLGVAAVGLWLLIAAGYYVWALTFDLGEIREMPQRSIVLDRRGQPYSRLAGENRVVAPFDQISKHFVDALITREDTRFYEHHGVDPIGIVRALVRNLTGGGVRQGASTITQQLARNSFPLGGRNLHRKLIEAALAFRIETELGKEDILAAYMNRIYFGSGCYGVETASRAYFGHPAARLSLGEAALLAGLIRSPSRFSPFNNLEAAIRNRDVVLGRMADLGFITAAERDAARREPVRLAAKPAPPPGENWAMESIRRELALVLPEDRLAEGGLRIFTTLDADLQRTAERAVAARLAQVERRAGYSHESSANPLEAAVLAIDHRTGGIRVVVGGRDYARSKFHRAFDARRPAGSTAKPFVFAAAFAHGVSPNDRVSDARLGRAEIPRELGAYDPANFDGRFGGEIRVREALIESRNTASVRVGLRAGLSAVADTLERAGLAHDLAPYPSLCLGSFETTLKDLTAAYTAFPNGGVRRQPYLIEKIVDAEGVVLFEATRGRIRFLEERSARTTAGVLEEVLERGTAASARTLGLRGRAGGKTGTTDEFRDAWFVGSTDTLTCGVWVGFDQPRTILKGGTGADLALPIWVDVVKAAR